MFVKSKSCHGLDCIQSDDCSEETCNIVANIMSNHMIDSNDYKVRTSSRAFLQGFSSPRRKNDGWVLIEFWTDNQYAIEAFICHLNNKLTKRKT